MDGFHWANIRLISLTVVLLYHYKPLAHFPMGFSDKLYQRNHEILRTSSSVRSQLNTTQNHYRLKEVRVLI